MVLYFSLCLLRSFSFSFFSTIQCKQDDSCSAAAVLCIARCTLAIIRRTLIMTVEKKSRPTTRNMKMKLMRGYHTGRVKRQEWERGLPASKVSELWGAPSWTVCSPSARKTTQNQVLDLKMWGNNLRWDIFCNPTNVAFHKTCRESMRDLKLTARSIRWTQTCSYVESLAFSDFLIAPYNSEDFS